MYARTATVIGALAATAIAACASSGSSDVPVQAGQGAHVDRTRTIETPEGANIDYTVRTSNFVSSDVVAAPIDSVWSVLPAIWQSLGITIDGVSQKDHRLQSGQMRIRRQLGGVSLSRFIECGRSTQGPNADVYFIVMKVESVVSGKNGQVLVQSAMAVTGEGTGNGGANVRCSTTGELERRIAERVAERVAERTVARPKK